MILGNNNILVCNLFANDATQVAGNVAKGITPQIKQFCHSYIGRNEH